MKRSHRRCHRWLWPLLLVGGAAVIALALHLRPDAPLTRTWPSALAAAKP